MRSPRTNINDDECDVENEVDDGLQMQDVNMEDELGVGDDNIGENNQDGTKKFERKKRAKNSKVHKDFEEVTLGDGTPKFKCKYCSKLLCRPAGGTTSQLLNHIARCVQKKLEAKKQKTLQFQPSKSKFEMNPLSDGRYDHLKQREAVAHWILMHEQPFNAVEAYGFSFMFKVNLPQFEKISRTTTRNDVITVYDLEKNKLQLKLKNINKISLTTDIWKSKVQKISYMCVTGHFVDSQWQLQKQVLSFMPLPPPHTGIVILNYLISKHLVNVEIFYVHY